MDSMLVAGRTLLSFAVLLLMTRLMGKKQISQLTFFDYVTGITIGSMAASLAIDTKVPIAQALIGLVGWSALTILIGYIILKSTRARVVIDGQPTILVKNGKIQEQALVHSRINIDDLHMMLRTQKVFSIADVDYAILEPNGKVSVLKKIDQENVTKKDLQVATPPDFYMPCELISDGKIVERNLQELDLDRDWLLNQVHMAGFKDLKEVFYAELQRDGTVHFDQRKTGQEANG